MPRCSCQVFRSKSSSQCVYMDLAPHMSCYRNAIEERTARHTFSSTMSTSPTGAPPSITPSPNREHTEAPQVMSEDKSPQSSTTKVYPDPDHKFYPLLHSIAQLESLSWVKLLVSNGADPTIILKRSITSAAGRTFHQPSLIHLCVLHSKRFYILEFLLSMKVSPNIECSTNRLERGACSRTLPLHMARSASVVHNLVRYGAN
ncbi:hypothetical protein V8F33_013959, partial [Rhypophila sp. PSN 637]